MKNSYFLKFMENFRKKEILNLSQQKQEEFFLFHNQVIILQSISQKTN